MPLTRLKNRLLARVFTRFPRLAARWGERLSRTGGEVPWSRPGRPLFRARLALVTTGGVHLASQPPFDMTDPDGDPSFREVPVDSPRDDLTITHDYYDHRDAQRDLNLVFPAELLAELVRQGALGSLHPTAFSLMGHIDGEHLATLGRRTAVEIGRRLAAAGVDYALLVPA